MYRCPIRHFDKNVLLAIKQLNRTIKQKIRKKILEKQARSYIATEFKVISYCKCISSYRLVQVEDQREKAPKLTNQPLRIDKICEILFNVFYRVVHKCVAFRGKCIRIVYILTENFTKIQLTNMSCTPNQYVQTRPCVQLS